MHQRLQAGQYLLNSDLDAPGAVAAAHRADHFAQEHGISIFNANRGGTCDALRRFERNSIALSRFESASKGSPAST